ncbi:glutathione S-transferase [Pandoraea capi]|uniref:Glutathione S-transferase n=1 Tax=Pandoraea capi TaxID=2508286 RepID=A0ABY6VR41_9BURK|nr:glutathione S-transferase [Pandoraea capi]VVD73622.1 glutathione S-transferase [Pandoraea capi]
MNLKSTSSNDETLADMAIYDFPRGPYPTRVRIALAEKAMEPRVKFELVDLYKGDHKRPAFMAEKNYSGTVPVLQLRDGTYIAECTAITEYLDWLDGSPTLTGNTPLTRAKIHMMNKRAELELLDPISVYFHHATPGLGPDVELYQNEEWGIRQREKAERGMQYFNDLLETQAYIAGDEFSMADITVIAGLLFASYVKVEVPETCKALKAWHERVMARPSVRHQPAFAG